MLQLLSKEGDFWYVATLVDERSLDAGILVQELATMGVTENVFQFDNVSNAVLKAREQSRPGDRIVVTGSFITVGGAMSWLNTGK